MIPNPIPIADSETQECEFCGATRDGRFTVRTGVSASATCRDCAELWFMSDQTRESLQELREGFANRIRSKEPSHAS